MSSESVIDACVHHHWVSQDDVMQYMSRGWREYLNQPRVIPGANEPPIPILPAFPYHHPDGDKLPDSQPESGPPGSSLELIGEQLLDAHGIERAVLSHDVAMYTPSTPNPHLAREIARAANDWTIDRWLSADERLRGLILVPNQTIDDAVAEIERLAPDPRMVGVLMAANGLSKPFGHPLYHPIYRAASEWGLPIVIHAGGDALSEALSHTAAGGHPATYGEYHAFRPQALMTHITSMIVQGAFEKHPGLRVLLVGAGAAWVPSLFWRFDTEYSAYRRETPWVRKMPSEYLRERVRVSVYPLDKSPQPEQLLRYLEAFGGFEDLLVYASGYPDWDASFPSEVKQQLPEAWHRKVLHDNARDLFRWEAPARPDRLEPATAGVGAME